MSEANEFGPYQPVRVLATGAHSQVWLANGPSGEVALKVARTDAARPVLRHEAEILGKVHHPNIVKLIEADPDGKWIATERARGMLFEQFGQVRPYSDLAKAALALVDALEALHAAGVIHGDVKPANILVDSQGRPILIDLGISTLAGDERKGFKGTLGFIAPEVLRGEAPSAQSDWYGLGATLFASVAERAPFVAPDPAALTYLPLVSLPPPPSAFRPDLPQILNRLILGMLARDPKRRPNPTDVRAALTQTVGSKASPPILGMHEEREALRRAVVGAVDGEPRVVVLYGPAGSGRRTLITEAVEHARREGLPYLKGADARTAITQLKAEKLAGVIVLRSQPPARRLAQRVLDEAIPCLLLLHADRPFPNVAQKSVVQLTPSPLSARDVAMLARVSGADPDNAQRWWRESLGLPIGVIGRIRSWKRQQSGDPLDPSVLPSEARRILETLQQEGTQPVRVLAEKLELGEHILLDHCEVLFAEGLVGSSEDGDALHVVPAAAAG
jgi:predicted Ser/Thr protein kinase